MVSTTAVATGEKGNCGKGKNRSNPKDPDLTRIFRIAVRNSNIDQIEAFTAEGLQQIFDYTQWLSTKRNQHRMTPIWKM